MIGRTPGTTLGVDKADGAAAPQVDGVDGQDEVDNDVCGELNPNLRPDGKPRFRSVTVYIPVSLLIISCS